MFGVRPLPRFRMATRWSRGKAVTISGFGCERRGYPRRSQCFSRQAVSRQRVFLLHPTRGGCVIAKTGQHDGNIIQWRWKGSDP